MALKATIRRAVRQAFLALDDIPRKATYHVTGLVPVRDLETGESTTPTTDRALTLVVFTSFSSKEKDLDAAIDLTDTKVLFPMEDLAGHFPTNSDSLTDDAGKKLEIVRVLCDPAALLAKLQCRYS